MYLDARSPQHLSGWQWSAALALNSAATHSSHRPTLQLLFIRAAPPQRRDGHRHVVNARGGSTIDALRGVCCTVNELDVRLASCDPRTRVRVTAV